MMSQVRALLAASIRSGACSLVRLERPAHNRAATGSNPVRPMTFLDYQNNAGIDTFHSSIDIKSFENYLRLQKSLSESRIKSHIGNLNIYLRSGLELDIFMLDIKKKRAVSTYRDYLCTMKVFYRDYLKQPEIIQDYKFPQKPFMPKILPTKEELKKFYDALPDKYKIHFMMLISSGLRVSEFLNADIDRNKRMIIPQPHEGRTKRAWLSFYNKETAILLDDTIPDITVDGLNRIFRKTYKKTGIQIYPHLLRAIFAQEMSLRKVPDRYIDAFCGRIPSSVLAKHYSDYSPSVLKEIYDNANLVYFQSPTYTNFRALLK
jgi:integrase